MRLHLNARGDWLCAGFIRHGLGKRGMLGRARFRWVCKDMVLALFGGYLSSFTLPPIAMTNWPHIGLW